MAKNLTVYRVELNRFLSLGVDMGPCAGYEARMLTGWLAVCQQRGTELVAKWPSHGRIVTRLINSNLSCLLVTTLFCFQHLPCQHGLPLTGMLLLSCHIPLCNLQVPMDASG